jgi:CopG antitoxin of type II toxin-antitoxin system
MKKPKPIPAFKTEADERRFWESHGSADYIDRSKAVRVRFPNLKPSTTAISDTESSADLSGHGTLR